MIKIDTPANSQIRMRDSGCIVVTTATPTQYAEGCYAVSIKWPEGAYGYIPVTQADNV
jgi:hypothetical protein